jgi:hypothetical protein
VEEEDPTLAAANNQAELMQWHYRLGHSSFKALKRLLSHGSLSSLSSGGDRNGRRLRWMLLEAIATNLT